MGQFHMDNSIHECIYKLEQVEAVLEDTYTLANQLEKRIQDMKWRGEHRDHFLALLNIVLQYHNDLKESGREICEVMKGLQSSFESYEIIESVIGLIGIKE